MTTYETLAARARARLPDLDKWSRQAPYELKGILHSEILFLIAVLEGVPFRRLLESGRARGQSTLMLSLALPDREIVSIEFNRDSADVAIAEARLKGRPNVTLLYGDARRLLPAMVRDGDIILIDGPKGFRSVRLAISLLATGYVSHVFVHDLTVGTPERAFLDANFPEALLSDCSDFAEVGQLADRDLIDVIPPEQKMGGFSGRFGYGFSLTALPYRPDRRYRWLLLKALFADFAARLGRQQNHNPGSCGSCASS